MLSLHSRRRAALADGISLYIAKSIINITTKTPVVSEEGNETTKIPMYGSRSFNQSMNTNHIRIILMGIGLLYGQAFAQQASLKPDWTAFQFLLGKWNGEGSGKPGQGNGIFTFSFDLQDYILIRRNQSDYPETKTHTAFSHNDLMVVYQEPSQSARAIYFDNEGHTIRYTTNISIDRKSITFISDSLPAASRFQLTYTSLSNDSLLMRFEIAPPTKPNNFSKYLEGRAHRIKSNPVMNSYEKKK